LANGFDAVDELYAGDQLWQLAMAVETAPSFSQRPVRETPDPRRVSFRLKEPWPDFLTFYPTATGAGWVVPKKYLQKVGDDGFKKAPIGAGPYKFVSDAAAEQ
jgi:ABC-type transport system substrate-binding protein